MSLCKKNKTKIERVKLINKDEEIDMKRVFAMKQKVMSINEKLLKLGAKCTHFYNGMPIDKPLIRYFD